MHVQRIIAVGLSVLVTFAVSAVLAFGQEPVALGLTVSGPGVKSIIVVDKLPFTVVAPSGEALYFWTIPAGITADDKGDKLDVTAAPNGQLTIKMKSIAVDWTAKKFVTKFWTATVVVGGLTPDPPPVPVDAFTASVQKAWAADGKDSKVAALAAIYRNSGATVNTSTTSKQVRDTMHAGAMTVVGSALPTVRRLLADELNAAMGTDDKPLDASIRGTMVAEFAKIQAALEACK